MSRRTGLLIITALLTVTAIAPATAVTRQEARLVKAERQWRRAQIRSYALRVRWCCSGANGAYTGASGEGSALLIVRRGHATRHPRAAAFGRISTVRDLFLIVRRNLRRHHLVVRYAARTGVPTSLSFDTKGIANSRRSLRITRFHRIPAH